VTVQFLEQFFNVYLVDPGAVFQRFQIGDLALHAFESEALENRKRFRVTTADISNLHISGDHPVAS
jgi:hypothetical protein